MKKKVIYLSLLLFLVMTTFTFSIYGDSKEKEIEDLLKYLTSEDTQVQDIGIKELSLFGDRAVNVLLNFALSQPQNSVSRKNGILCLGQIKTEKSAFALISFFISTKDFPQLVSSSLVNIGKPAVEPLISSFSNNGSYLKVLILGALNDIIDKIRNNSRDLNKVKKVFINTFLKDDSPAVRRTALHFLVQFEDEKDVKEILRHALHDRDPKIREIAKQILREK
jgi:HEAT repeat protein